MACHRWQTLETGARTERRGLSSLRLLLVQNNDGLAAALREVLEDLGHSVVAIARDQKQAETLAAECRPHLALMDLRLVRDGDGIEAARRLHAGCGVRSVFLAGAADHGTMARLTATYPLGVVRKPFSSAQLKVVLDLAARRLSGAPALPTPARTPADRSATEA